MHTRQECQTFFWVRTRPAQNTLDRVHIDTVGHITPATLTGERYWATVVDEFTHHVASQAAKSKDVISGAVRDLLVYWQTQRETTVYVCENWQRL